jgi:uncharacterized protein HemX
VPGDRVQLFREVVSAGISISILSVSLWMMADTYRSGRLAVLSEKSDEKQNAAEVKAKTEAFGRQKDLLLYALALMGTVTGYYLGRVPAELRAQQAQQTAHTSQNQLANTQDQLNSTTAAVTQAATSASRATATLASVRSKLAPATPQQRKTLGGEAALSPQEQAVLDAQHEIDEFFRRL